MLYAKRDMDATRYVEFIIYYYYSLLNVYSYFNNFRYVFTNKIYYDG